VHRHEITVRWGDCDPAAIAYYPRFFDFFHQAMESFFAAAGHPYEDVILGRKVGFPSVHAGADFRRPCLFGELLAVELRIGRIGRSSVEFLYRVCGAGGDVRLEGRTICAVMDLDPASPTFRRSLPLPEDLRDAFAPYVATQP
jgi:4-hydroxybenzoyl-CoA thioesterase